MLHLWSLRPMSLISIFAYFTRSWISSTRYVPTKTKRQRHFFDISIKDNSDLVYHSLRTQTKAASTALQKSWPFKRISNRNAVIIYSLSCHFEPVWNSVSCGTKGILFCRMYWFSHVFSTNKHWSFNASKKTKKHHNGIPKWYMWLVHFIPSF